MDDNPFANPFADDADGNPFATGPTPAGYSSGFDTSSRRASVVSANAASETGNAFGQEPPRIETEESPYLRKLERDGVISGITSPSAFQQPSFSTSTDTPRNANEEIDAFHGGFYSPPAFSPVNPPTNQQAFGLDESVSAEGSQDRAERDQPGPSHVQQDDLEALGLAPAVDPTSSLKAAFIKHQPPQPKPEPQETPAENDKPVAETASPTKPQATKPRPSNEGLSAGARRKKKIVGISMDTVQKDRERERERLEKEREERERLMKERQEREKVEAEERERAEKENMGKKDASDADKAQDKKPSEPSGEPDATSPTSPTERQPTISSTTAEQILLASNPHQASQAIARRIDGQSDPTDDLSALPPLPESGQSTRASTPQPATGKEVVSPSRQPPHASSTSPSHAHPGVIRPHLDPVITSPLDATRTDEEDTIQPTFQALALGGSSTRPPAQSGRSSWGRAFEEEDPVPGSVEQSASGALPSAGWTTNLPTSNEGRETWGSPEAQTSDSWGGNGFAQVSSCMHRMRCRSLILSKSSNSPVRPTANRPLSAVSIKSPSPSATAPPPPPKTESPAFIIRIHDPTRVGDPIRGHVVYTVTTRTSSPHYASRESSVLRRFSQFLWLVERVGMNNPGVIVPPVPDKQLSGTS